MIVVVGLTLHGSALVRSSSVLEMDMDNWVTEGYIGHLLRLDKQDLSRLERQRSTLNGSAEIRITTRACMYVL